MRDILKQAARKILLAIRDIGASLLGIAGWLFHVLLAVMTTGFIMRTILCLLIHAKVKPDLGGYRELAYGELAQMERTNFSKLSNTAIHNGDGHQIEFINAGCYQYVGTTGVSMNIQSVYIAQEDRCFKSHTDVDWIATFRAGLTLAKYRGQVTQGGSTITQQVIKNTYLTQKQTFTHKIVEVLLAPKIEREYSRAGIMEFYCNTDFYGHQCYGVEAANRHYFDKHAADLTVEEAAVLVGISDNPSAYGPVAHPKASLEKHNDVPKSMSEIGKLSDEDYGKALSGPLSMIKQESERTNEDYQNGYVIHCAALELLKRDGLQPRYTFEDKDDYNSYMEHYTAAYVEKPNLIHAGGFKIHTSLGNHLQDMLQADTDQGLFSCTELQDNGKYALQGTGVIMDDQSSYVVAIVGGGGSVDQSNRAYLSAKQPGNAIKPLVDYGPVSSAGEYPPTHTVDDHKWGDGPSNNGGDYHGSVTVREVLDRNLNTMTWQILEDIDVNYGPSCLGEMEFQKLTYVSNGVLSSSIGGSTNGVRVVDTAKGYNTLANYGVYDGRTCITQIIHGHNGDLTKDLPPTTKQVCRDGSTFILTGTLKGTITSPYGTGRGLELNNDMPVVDKTGTTNGSKDTWLHDYTRYYITAVWVGYDIPREMPDICGNTYAEKI